MAKYKLPKKEISSSSVNEPQTNYFTTSHPIMLAGVFNIPEDQMTPFEKMSVLQQGLNKSNLERLKFRAQLDYDKLSQALSVTRATLINKKGEEKYSDTVAERILALSDLYSFGYTVFEDETKFNDWMFRPNSALGNKMPFDIVDNQFGREEIKNIIGRIEYGVFS